MSFVQLLTIWGLTIYLHFYFLVLCYFQPFWSIFRVKKLGIWVSKIFCETVKRFALLAQYDILFWQFFLLQKFSWMKSLTVHFIFFALSVALIVTLDRSTEEQRRISMLTRRLSYNQFILHAHQHCRKWSKSGVATLWRSTRISQSTHHGCRGHAGGGKRTS